MAVEKTQYTANGATITRYLDTLINGASGVIEMVFINDDILRAVMIGKFKSNNAANGLHIGTIPSGSRATHSVLYPMLASRTIRDMDGFIQINNDGKIYIMEAKANMEYTFCIPLPVRY